MKRHIAHPFYDDMEAEIERIDTKADKYRNAFYVMRIGLIAITGIITITSGLKGITQTNGVLNFILILGAVVTAMTSLDTLFQIETKKNVYKLMLVELREIRSEIIFYATHQPGALDERIRTHLFPKYQAVMAYSKTLVEKKDKAEEPGK